MPADLAAVQADDALLDMIAAGHAPSDADDELTRVLAEWRREVHAEPISELVDTSAAIATIRAAARQPARRRNPMFGSAAAVAAAVAIAFSGVGLVAKSAQPGDHLWGVTQVLYSDYARSVETAAAVRTELNEANTALKQHNPERARAALQRVQQQLPVIGEAEGRTDLTARHRQLEQRLLTGSPDTGSANLPEGPGFPSSTPTGAGPGASTSPAPNELPAPAEPTTTPESAKDLNRDPSTTPSDRFLPSHEYPRRYAPPGAAPDSRVQGSRPSRDGSSADVSGEGSGNADNNGGPRPSPTPSRDGGNPAGTGPSTGYVGGPRPPGSRFPSFCEHAAPRPPYCG